MSQCVGFIVVPVQGKNDFIDNYQYLINIKLFFGFKIFYAQLSFVKKQFFI